MTKPPGIDIAGLTDMAAWAAADPQFSPWVWLQTNTSAQTAVALTTLFWPEVVEHQGGIFLKEAFDPSIFDQWHTQLAGEISAVERVMNHKHLHDLFASSDGVSMANLSHLGYVIAATWRARLETAWPQRAFDVLVGVSQDDEEVTVTFCQRT